MSQFTGIGRTPVERVIFGNITSPGVVRCRQTIQEISRQIQEFVYELSRQIEEFVYVFFH